MEAPIPNTFHDAPPSENGNGFPGNVNERSFAFPENHSHLLIDEIRMSLIMYLCISDIILFFDSICFPCIPMHSLTAAGCSRLQPAAAGCSGLQRARADENSMEFHRFQGIPRISWNLVDSIESNGIPWNSIPISRNIMNCMEFHGIP